MHSNRITHPISFINLWEDTYETVTCAIQSFRPVFIRNISYISDHPTPLVRFGRQKPLSPKKSFFKARNSSSIIENEFGEIPIDDASLTNQKTAPTEKIVAMCNGW